MKPIPAESHGKPLVQGQCRLRLGVRGRERGRGFGVIISRLGGKGCQPPGEGCQLGAPSPCQKPNLSWGANHTGTGGRPGVSGWTRSQDAPSAALPQQRELPGDLAKGADQPLATMSGDTSDRDHDGWWTRPAPRRPLLKGPGDKPPRSPSSQRAPAPEHTRCAAQLPCSRRYCTASTWPLCEATYKATKAL